MAPLHLWTCAHGHTPPAQMLHARSASRKKRSRGSGSCLGLRLSSCSEWEARTVKEGQQALTGSVCSRLVACAQPGQERIKQGPLHSSMVDRGCEGLQQQLCSWLATAARLTDSSRVCCRPGVGQPSGLTAVCRLAEGARALLGAWHAQS